MQSKSLNGTETKIGKERILTISDNVHVTPPPPSLKYQFPILYLLKLSRICVYHTE